MGDVHEGRVSATPPTDIGPTTSTTTTSSSSEHSTTSVSAASAASSSAVTSIKFDKTSFTKKANVMALRVPTHLCGEVVRQFRGYLLSGRKVRSILDDPFPSNTAPSDSVPSLPATTSDVTQACDLANGAEKTVDTNESTCVATTTAAAATPAPETTTAAAREQVHEVTPAARKKGGKKSRKAAQATKVKPPTSGSESHKLVLLSPDVHSLDDLPDICRKLVAGCDVIPSYEVQFDHTHCTVEEILKTLLPSTISAIPSSFETVGHIAHLNLRDEQLPYRYLIGEVILAQNPNLRTVVTKVGSIHAVFRTFDMEIIAGEDNFETEVREGTCKFRFNYKEVYWNSRLQTEHTRLVSLFKQEDVICDVFAGVGPFAVPAAKFGCVVHANDLNPSSVKYLTQNAAINKVSKFVQCYNMDGRDFMRDMVAKGVKFNHVVMNLPASAITFVDVIRDFCLSTPCKWPSDAWVHCYTFSKKAVNPKTDAREQLLTALHPVVPYELKIHDVRNVSPHKEMLCVSFRVSGANATSVTGSVEEQPNQPSNKRCKC